MSSQTTSSGRGRNKRRGKKPQNIKEGETTTANATLPTNGEDSPLDDATSTANGNSNAIETENVTDQVISSSVVEETPIVETTPSIIETTTPQVDVSTYLNQIEQLRAVIVSKDEDISRITRDFYQAQEKLDVMDARFSSSQSELEDLKKTVVEMESSNENSQQRSEEQARLEKRVQELEATLAQQQDYITQVTARMEQMVKEKNSAIDVGTEGQIEELTRQLREYKARIEALKATQTTSNSFVITPTSPRHDLRPLALRLRDHWKHDQAYDNCRNCNDSFSLFNRRHHCRACGLIFCGNCVPGGSQSAWVGLNQQGNVVFVEPASPGSMYGKVCQSCLTQS